MTNSNEPHFVLNTLHDPILAALQLLFKCHLINDKN